MAQVRKLGGGGGVRGWVGVDDGLLKYFGLIIKLYTNILRNVRWISPWFFKFYDEMMITLGI